MVDKISKFIFQVEINTIASSMGFFSDTLKEFYLHFSKKYPEYFKLYDNKVPINKENVISNISESLFQAIKLFSPLKYEETVIVFIVQETERNEFDQRAIQNDLYLNQ